MAEACRRARTLTRPLSQSPPSCVSQHRPSVCGPQEADRAMGRTVEQLGRRRRSKDRPDHGLASGGPDRRPRVDDHLHRATVPHGPCGRATARRTDRQAILGSGKAAGTRGLIGSPRRSAISGGAVCALRIARRLGGGHRDCHRARRNTGARHNEPARSAKAARQTEVPNNDAERSGAVRVGIGCS